MISAGLVKELRDRTGAGMMDCKRALEQTEGDMEKAIEFLREKGLAQAAKKAGREANQGLVFGKVEGSRGVILELNCETDFVAKNEEFQKLGYDMVSIALEQNVKSAESLLLLPYEAATLQDALTQKIATIGENMALSRLEAFDTQGSGILDLYIHGGGRIAVIVQLSIADATKLDSPELKELAHDLALQIVAAKAQYISRDDIDAEAIEKEKAIYRAQALNEGRPEHIIDRMVDGRVRKFFEEVCLLEQAYIKDTNINVKTLVANLAKQCATEITVQRFVRFEIGEGA
jgi:elongation factor Ts